MFKFDPKNIKISVDVQEATGFECFETVSAFDDFWNR